MKPPFKTFQDFHDDMRRRTAEATPPKEIREYIEQLTNQTAEINKDNFDKQSFRLGMYSMWQKLNPPKPNL